MFRLSNRGLAPASVLAVEKKLDKKILTVPHARPSLADFAWPLCLLMRKPKCHICPVYDYCRFKDKAKIKDRHDTKTADRKIMV